MGAIDDTPLKCNDEAGELIWQPMKPYPTDTEFMEVMRERAKQVLEQFPGLLPVIGEMTNYSPGTSQEELYRKEFGL